MMNGAGGGSYRTARVIVSAAFMLTLVGCGGLGLLPRESKMVTTNFQTYDQVSAAYVNIVPGATNVTDLKTLGFDVLTTPNVEVLSYLGVIERFMPRDSVSFDHLAPPVRTCIEAQDRCSALVFHPQRIETHRVGSIFLDLFGFERETLNTGWSAEIILLVQDGRVAYKLMSGRPRIEDWHDKIQPLGPLQDIGNTAMHAASRIL